MNKLIKIGAVALFSLFVAACNKADPKADFKTLSDWSAAQQQSQIALQTELQQKLATQDPAQIEPVVNQFTAHVAEMEKSLAALDIKSPEIKVLKEKIEATLKQSNELVVEGLKAIKDPASVDQDALAEKTQSVVKSAEELQKLQAELQQKFGQQ